MTATEFRLTTGGVGYKRVKGPYVTATDTEVTAKETIAIQARDFVKFWTKAMPAPGIITKPDGTELISRPEKRTLPGAPFLVTQKVSIVDNPGAAGLPWDVFQADENAPAGTYEDLLFLDIEYKTATGGKKKDDEDEDPSDPETFLEYSVDVGGEYMMINPRKATWEGSSPGEQDEDNEDLQAPSAKIIPMINFSLRWPRVIQAPWAAIFANVGKVSTAPVQFLFNAPAETALFVGVSGKRDFVWWGNDGDATTNGFLLNPWTLDFKFQVKIIHLPDGTTGGWNHVYRPKKGIWQRLLVGGLPIYPAAANFNGLFLAAA